MDMRDQREVIIPIRHKPCLFVLKILIKADFLITPGTQRREPKPDPKKIMEDKVNSHDEKISTLEKLVEEQKKMLEEMGGKQVELEKQFTDNKVELERAEAENKVLEKNLADLQVKFVASADRQVELNSRVEANQVSYSAQRSI